MTSKISYWVKWKENVKRRNWTFVLCLVTMLFALPGSTAIVLNANMTSYRRSLASGENVQWLEQRFLEMQNILAKQAGFSEWMPFLAGFFAVLFAVQGFSFLYSRKKMDLYMSVPVSAGKRYLLICLNGIAVFGLSYLVSLVLTWLVGAAFGLLTVTIVADSAAAFLVNMIGFTAMYQLALAAVMLCGNLMTALLGCGVLFFYEAAARFLFTGLQGEFFTNYCSYAKSQYVDRIWLSPFMEYYVLSTQTYYSKGALVRSAQNSGRLLQGTLILLGLAVVLALLSYVLFRRRKTESYTQALAFPALKPVLELLLVVPFAVAVGTVVGNIAGDMNGFLFAATVLAGLVGHALIRLIYERDLRAVLQNRALALFSVAVSVFVVCIFRFDLTGYDRYVPDTEEIESVSVTLEQDYRGFGSYAVPFGDGYRPIYSELLENMNSGEADTIEAVRRMAKLWNDTKDQAKESEEKSLQTARRELIDGDCGEGNWMIVRYHLKSGRDVYRRFYGNGEAEPEAMETILADESYRRIRYQIYGEEFEESLHLMRMEYDDGKQAQLYTLEPQALLNAYKADFADYGYRTIKEEDPCGILRFVLEDAGEDWDCKWNYPVYESYENTIALLSENGIQVDAVENLLTPEDVRDITVTYYHYEYRADEEKLFADQEIREQEIVITIEDPEEIGMILKAVYPEELAQAADEDFCSVSRDGRFELRLTLTPDAYKKQYLVNGIFFKKGATPDFVVERIKNAAVE